MSEHQEDAANYVAGGMRCGKTLVMENVKLKAEVAEFKARVVDLEPQGRMFRWILKKWGIAEDTSDGDVMGAMHVAHSHAHGYETYITAYRCNDKQGEIARQAAHIEQLKTALQEVDSEISINAPEEDGVDSLLGHIWKTAADALAGPSDQETATNERGKA